MHALVMLALLNPVVHADKDEPAGKELFAKEDWYKDQAGKEEEFTGELSKEKAGGIGFGRFNPYRLTVKDGKRVSVFEVYVGGKTTILDDFVGKRVTIKGKRVDMEVEGKEHREIWPASITPVKEEKKPEPKGK